MVIRFSVGNLEVVKTELPVLSASMDNFAFMQWAPGQCLKLLYSFSTGIIHWRWSIHFTKYLRIWFPIFNWWVFFSFKVQFLGPKTNVILEKISETSLKIKWKFVLETRKWRAKMKENDRNLYRNLSILTKIAPEGREFFKDEIWIRNLQINSEMLKNLSIFVENDNFDRIFGACGA